MLAPTDERVRQFLQGSLVVMVATRSPQHRPFLTPLWFVVDDGAVYITTGPGTWAGRNVTQHAEVALLFAGEQLGHPDRVLRVRKWRLRTRYYGQVTGGFGHIRVVPTACEFLALP